MPNKDGNVYGLTTLCPLKSKEERGVSPISYTRNVLQSFPITGAKKGISPMAKVPNTYLARFLILDDTLFQGYPNKSEHLQSKYLVFTASFHGELEPYLQGMYANMEKEIHQIWKFGIGFDAVKSPETFELYIKKCQVETTYLFNGSTDDSLEEQLKSLYLKQEFSKFVFEHQGIHGEKLLNDFKIFCNDHKPNDLTSPTWLAGV